VAHSSGIVDVEFKPYEPLLASMRQLNARIYQLADYFARQSSH
jgi:hypothetical protein